MVDSKVAGLIAAIIGVIGMANYGVQISKDNVFGLISIAVFAFGLYLALNENR